MQRAFVLSNVVCGLLARERLLALGRAVGMETANPAAARRAERIGERAGWG